MARPRILGSRKNSSAGRRTDHTMGRSSTMRPVALFAGLLAGFLVLPSFAQGPPPDGTPTRVRGTVEKLDAQTLTVKSRDGQNLTITLAPNVTVSAVVKKTSPT